MTFEILALLVLLGVALVLFATEVVSVDVTAAILLLGMFAAGLLDPSTVFDGFGDDVVVFLGSLFVVSEGLVRTGALDRVELALGRLAEQHPNRLLVLLLLGTTAISAFLSNTATMAAVLPLAMSLARRLRTSPAKILMPLAFGSILGGSISLIGTSTNIVVSGVLPRFDEPPLSLFELAPVALPAAVIGIVYMITLGRRLLPDRGGEVLDTYRVREYLAEAIVPPGSPWVGRTLRELEVASSLDITVLGEVGADGNVQPITPARRLAAGDVLMVKADQAALLKLKKRKELDLRADHAAAPGPPVVHEIVLTNNSRLARRTLREMDFRRRYQLNVLALYRRGEPRRLRLADTRLRDGDVLLVQGDLGRLEWMLRGGDAILLEEAAMPPATWRLGVAVAAFLGMLVAGGLSLAPFSVTAFAAAAVVILAGCVPVRDAYAAVDWRILVMVACLLAVATAMETTGTAQYLAEHIVAWARDLGPRGLLAGFYLLTVVLTQPMSNQASALVVLPVALRTATELSLDPRAFAITVCLAASCSFVTPLEPASLLVYGPGRYRFRDYFVMGLPLTLLVMAVTLWIVPHVWPL